MKDKIITIIELLNDVSKDEIVPSQIKYLNKVYTFEPLDKTYYDENDENFFEMYNFRILNDTVEILPEENYEWEDIEEINSNADNTLFVMECYTGIPEKAQDWNFNILEKEINQLIKNQKYLKEKLESIQRTFTDEIKADTSKWIVDTIPLKKEKLEGKDEN